MEPDQEPGGPDTPLARVVSRLGWGSAALGVAAFALWVSHVAGCDLPVLSRIVVVAAVAAGSAWLAARRIRAWRGGGRRASLLVPTILLLLALAVRFTGLSHEVDGRYYLDEGTYYHHASEIDKGFPLRLSFVYPHLMYYLDAFTLWLVGLFPGISARWAAAVGVTDPLSIQWLALRAVVALLSTLTVVPVFRIAKRLSGPLGGAAAALLLIFSPLYNDGSHLNICDVPSAVFATFCLYFVVRLIDEETTRDYLLAGVCAGLAAGSKYPAGVVAVAIVAVWMRWRIARRDFSFGLLWAGLAALATFAAVMPSMVVFPQAAFQGSRGIFFGVHQYGQGGWLGVVKDSNSGFYAGRLVESFGWAATVIGLSGVLFARRGELARRLWLLPFPVLYLALIAAMSMVVKRNLYPVVPVLSALLGVGISTWLDRLAALEWPRPVRAVVAAAVLVACAWAPVEATARQDASYAAPSTRDQAAAWIRSHVPRGASILKESYTPDLGEGEYRVDHLRFAARLSLAELRQYDYVLLASSAYERFLDPASLSRPHQKEIAERYQEVFRAFELVQEWQPDEDQMGPVLRLYRPR